ncbi:MAG TPA: polysaccharide deacetylase family protein, partial [Arthrobacter sp.]|nr:polysaccharide deacetylase family protein [Arthrobacter sp.]
MAVSLAVAWIWPGATAPLWQPQLNQSARYPRRLLATGYRHNIPVLGADTDFAFDRIALVEHNGSKVLLKDPFSETVYREATDDDKKLIGNRSFVIDKYGKPADHQLMLTFDDGPDPRFTPELLDLLSKEKVPATFFEIGENVVKFPDVFKRVIREGHMVGNHTMFHSDFWAHDDYYNREAIVGTDRVMRATDNYATRLFRIPTGDPENNTLALLQAQQLGFLHVDMDLDTLDWERAPGEPVPLPNLDGKGHIVLLHDGGGDRTATVNMLKTLIPRAKALGYTFSTLQPLLASEYVPQQTAPEADDYLTLATYTGILVAPDVIITWLFWFGIGSLTVLTFLYVVLAVINNRRQRRRRWDAIPEEDWPLVSVVLPVYNEERVVEKTLAALQVSDYPRFEVVAVNDGFTDNTLAVLREYASTWPQLQVLDQPNGGKSEASNNGISHSRGEVVVTLD